MSETLADMQMEHEKSHAQGTVAFVPSLPECTELIKAMVAAQKALPIIPKNGTNPYHKSSYELLEDVVGAVTPILSDNGLWLTMPCSFDGSFLQMQVILAHESGQAMVSEFRLPADMGGPQKIGSAETYARRYALRAVLNLRCGDNDDGERAEGRDGGPKTRPCRRCQQTFVPDGREQICPKCREAKPGDDQDTLNKLRKQFDEKRTELGVTVQEAQWYLASAGGGATKLGDMSPETAQAVVEHFEPTVRMCNEFHGACHENSVPPMMKAQWLDDKDFYQLADFQKKEVLQAAKRYDTPVTEPQN